jgi:methylmalonyl-CoA mutase cobalamin-binding domain/chain
MEELYQDFFALLDQAKKDECVDWAMAKLASQEIEIVQLYTDILAKSLNNLECVDEDKWACIWKEHVKTGIVRTIVECAYPYVRETREARCGATRTERVIVVCPKEEYHELGARIVTDFFTMAGYDAIFIGGNTPEEAFLSAIALEQPKYVAISVSNPYHLFAAQKMIQKLRVRGGEQLEIIVGGQAVQKDPMTYQKIGADRQLNTFDEICKLDQEA